MFKLVWRYFPQTNFFPFEKFFVDWTFTHLHPNNFANQIAHLSCNHWIVSSTFKYLYLQASYDEVCLVPNDVQIYDHDALPSSCLFISLNFSAIFAKFFWQNEKFKICSCFVAKSTTRKNRIRRKKKVGERCMSEHVSVMYEFVV